MVDEFRRRGEAHMGPNCFDRPEIANKTVRRILDALEGEETYHSGANIFESSHGDSRCPPVQYDARLLF